MPKNSQFFGKKTMSHWGPTGPQCDIVYFAKSCQKNTTKIKPKNSHNFQMTLSNREKGFVGDSNHNQPKNSSKISTNAKSGWRVFFQRKLFLESWNPPKYKLFLFCLSSCCSEHFFKLPQKWFERRLFCLKKGDGKPTRPKTFVIDQSLQKALALHFTLSLHFLITLAQTRGRGKLVRLCHCRFGVAKFWRLHDTKTCGLFTCLLKFKFWDVL